MGYDAVIFDNDGVLIERPDTDVLRQAARRTFREFGVKDLDESDLKSIIRGVTRDELQRICDTYGLDPHEFWRERDTNASEFQRRTIREGKKTLYDDMSVLNTLGSSYDLGIVSNNQQSTIDFIVDFFDMDPLFDVYYGRKPTPQDLSRKKPSPYYIERALKVLNTHNALYVGDSRADITAAHKAGIDSVFVRRPHREDYGLEREPTYQVQDLHGLTRILNGKVRR